jgi:hypothetical protein
MQKLLSLIYIIFILIFSGFGFKLFTERGAGIATTENILIGLFFIILFAIVSYTHYSISRSISNTPNYGLSIVSILNVLTTLSLILSITLLPESGGLVTAGISVIMSITLIITTIISIVVLIKKPRN